jgi:hypothetical protein
MVPGPGRASIAAGALQQLYQGAIGIAHGMNLLIDYNVRIFQFKSHARPILIIQ